jgi:hypothetical protein
VRAGWCALGGRRGSVRHEEADLAG